MIREEIIREENEVSISGRTRVKARIRTRRARRPYETVAIGLYRDQTIAIDQAIQELQQAGYIKANRSLLFQTLAEKFLREMKGCDQQQMIAFLLSPHLKRPLARAVPRDDGHEPKENPRRSSSTQRRS